jgi:acyl dehydratase
MTVGFDELRQGDVVPSLARIVTREDVRTYAELSGDLNPLHLDDGVARAAGFPGIIAHGMFTMAHMVACVVNWTGDPARIERLSAQFRSPVFMGDEVVAGGRVRVLDDAARTATLELWVTVDRAGATETPIRKGEALVRLE